MSYRAFRKAMYELPLSQAERDSLTGDELFVLVVAHRMDRLSWAEQKRMSPEDVGRLAAAGLLPGTTPCRSDGSSVVDVNLR
jgi:hypothetical protein